MKTTKNTRNNIDWVGSNERISWLPSTVLQMLNVFCFVLFCVCLCRMCIALNNFRNAKLNKSKRNVFPNATVSIFNDNTKRSVQASMLSHSGLRCTLNAVAYHHRIIQTKPSKWLWTGSWCRIQCSPLITKYSCSFVSYFGSLLLDR